METKLLNPPFSQLWPRELHRYFKLIRVTVNKRRGAYTRPGSKRAYKFKLGLQSGSEKTKRGPAHLSTFTLDLAWMRGGRAIPQDKRGEHLPDLASVPDCLLLSEVGGWFSSSQTKLAQKPQLCLFRLLYVVVPSNICVPCTFFKKNQNNNPPSIDVSAYCSSKRWLPQLPDPKQRRKTKIDIDRFYVIAYKSEARDCGKPRCCWREFFFFGC